MKKFLFGLAALPFLASVTLAAEPLSDPQMDRISAGAGDPGCMSSTTSTCFSIAPTGCTNLPGNSCAGQVFTPKSPQTFFTDLNAFLNQVGFKIP
jgi:hypothetical protein